MKKHLRLILSGAALAFALAIFGAMAGDVFDLSAVNSWGLNASFSVYGAIGAEEPSGIAITALIFFILGLIASLMTLALSFLKSKFAAYSSIAGFLLLLVAGITYFCVTSGSNASLGVGSVLSGVFALLSALLLGGVALLNILKI